MKFTLSWLKEHLDTSAGLTEITDALTMLGLELEGVEDRAAALADFTIAHVVEAKPHPNADRLRLCLVDTGQETLQVVCGAPNARTGMKGVFAAAGTYIPGTEMTLKPGNIRGEASNGMLCSERELMLSDDHDGIIDLPADAPVGARYVDYAGLSDPVIDIAITPNRADCLGVRGVARDLAAAGLGTLKPLDTGPVTGDFDSPIRWRLEFAEGREHLCPLVAGRYFRGVKNGPSPKWMQDRLIAVGLRPISALVDITNYVMIDVGRPLHAYDADKVDGDIIIRQAKPGEKYLALNGREYTFDPEMIVIGDQHGPDDLAGIMGGEKTGCGDDTTNMFLEVAVFDETTIAATGRKLNLQSDARYRFERGLDQTSPHWGTELATKLVLEICGGSASTVVVDGPGRPWQRQIPLRHSRIKALCGVDIDAAAARRILADLGFEVTGEGEAMTVAPPPWRGDIDGEADLIEEIVRINGFDKIEAVSMSRPHVIGRPALSPTQRRV
ncbi:MAG: phenylalanine--tRNA ligase subunit beta, partial [Pseudomonadota bacterium]|nr:phenylalanine--tRNA ligase subunit beta [Pseudomonadota bacterium]